LDKAAQEEAAQFILQPQFYINNFLAAGDLGSTPTLQQGLFISPIEVALRTFSLMPVAHFTYVCDDSPMRKYIQFLRIFLLEITKTLCSKLV